MFILEYILTGVALAMDAFSVSVCKGLSQNKIQFKYALVVALFFGGFQAFMPIVGYVIIKNVLSAEFARNIIETYSPIIAFVLLAIIGFKMIWDAIKEDEDSEHKIEKSNNKINYIELTGLAIATSIDALMIGFAYSMVPCDIVSLIAIIGIVTAILSFVGVYIGNFFGSKWNKISCIVGGSILIVLGLKFLIVFIV